MHTIGPATNIGAVIGGIALVACLLIAGAASIAIIVMLVLHVRDRHWQRKAQKWMRNERT